MGRCSGKTVALIQLASEKNAAIFVSSKFRAEALIAMAIRLGIKPPRIVVLARGQQRGISIAEILVDHQDDCRSVQR